MLTVESGSAKADPEVLAKARRRRFTAEYKLRVVREYEVAVPGQRGAILRREGLYSSHIDAWRKQQKAAGSLSALEPKKRGRKPTKRRDEVAIENERLRKRVLRLEHELARAEKVIDVQKKISELLGGGTEPPGRAEGRGELMEAVTVAAGALGGTKLACEVLGVSRASYYRAQRPKSPARKRPSPPRALSEPELRAVLETLNSERFADQPPAQVHASLLDEGQYLCSVRTMYRVLDAHAQVRERRDQLRHPARVKPELVATRPNQLWSSVGCWPTRKAQRSRNASSRRPAAKNASRPASSQCTRTTAPP